MHILLPEKFRLKLLFSTMELSKFKDGRNHFRNSGVKGLKISSRDIDYTQVSADLGPQGLFRGKRVLEHMPNYEPLKT